MGQQGSVGSILVCLQGSIDSIIVGQQGSVGSILVCLQGSIGSIIMGRRGLQVTSLCASRGT